MPVIRNRADAVLAAAKKSNPTLPMTLTTTNCYVYRFGSFSITKGFCTIRGRYGSGLRNKVVVTYRKLDIATLIKSVTPRVYFSGAKTTADLLPAINDAFGLDLVASEIVDSPLSSDGTTATLKIANSSNLYTGSVTLYVWAAKIGLPAVLTVRDLVPVLNSYPAGSKVPGAVLTAGHDYTSIGPQLSSVTTGVLTDAVVALLVPLLTAVDGIPWTSVSPAVYSLKNAQVVYNGVMSGLPASYATLNRTTYSNVMVLIPDATANTNLAIQPVVFYYNVF
mgnify:FL=1